MERFYDDILTTIFGHLDESLIVLAFTCKQWNELLNVGYLNSNRNVYIVKNLKYICSNGRTNLFEWFKTNFENVELALCRMDCIEEVVKGGQLQMVIWWLQSVGYHWHWLRCCNAAAEYGQLDIFKWVFDNNYHPVAATSVFSYIDAAAKGGHFEVIQHLETLGYHTKYPSACVSAAFGNQLGTLKQLREHGCPWTTSTSLAAAKKVILNV